MTPSRNASHQPRLDVGRIYTERLNFLMESSSILASCLNREAVFDRLARAAVPFLAEWCSIIALEGEEGTFTRVGVAHVDPDLERRLRGILRPHLPSVD